MLLYLHEFETLLCINYQVSDKLWKTVERERFTDINNYFKGFTYGGIALEWIFDAENIDVALVEKMMKHINGLNCGRSLLFEAENPVKNQKIGMMYSDAYKYIVTFGQNSSKLNNRPVYCSRLYGI